MNELIEQGEEIVTQLSQQQKQLQNIESSMNEIEYNFKKSKRLLRSMTWRGWFINLFTNEPSRQENTCLRQVSISFDCPKSNNPDIYLNEQAEQLLGITKAMNEIIVETNKLKLYDR